MATAKPHHIYPGDSVRQILILSLTLIFIQALPLSHILIVTRPHTRSVTISQKQEPLFVVYATSNYRCQLLEIS